LVRKELLVTDAFLSKYSYYFGTSTFSTFWIADRVKDEYGRIQKGGGVFKQSTGLYAA
jgi:hypothetical protein